MARTLHLFSLAIAKTSFEAVGSGRLKSCQVFGVGSPRLEDFLGYAFLLLMPLLISQGFAK